MDGPRYRMKRLSRNEGIDHYRKNRKKGGEVIRKILGGLLVVCMLFAVSGCGLVSTAISAGIGYGIYQLTKD